MKERQLVWAICFYLVAVYIFFGITCFLVWDRSGLFQVIGWSWDHPGSENLQKILYSLCAGALGATSYSFWQLFHFYCSLKKFDSAWTVWYIFGPISGSLLGIATYSVVVGGLLVLGESVTLRSNWAIFALSFLTGFSAKRVLRKLHAIAGQIFQEAEAPKKTTPCSNCGAEVEEKARFCPSCGKEIERPEKSELVETAEVPSQNNKGASGDV
jgi:predicted RNA-binding Zn-ribbon protein involved in translation (DUF1610 family)